MTTEETRTLSQKIDVLAGNVATLSGAVSCLSTDVARMDERIKAIQTPGASPMCAVHEHRMDEMEDDVERIAAAQGKQNLIAMTLGAVAGGIVLAIKYAIGARGV